MQPSTATPPSSPSLPPSPWPLLTPRAPPCTSIVVPGVPYARRASDLNFPPPPSPCWPNSNAGCFAYGTHECISRRLNSKYVIEIPEPNLGCPSMFLGDKSSDDARRVIHRAGYLATRSVPSSESVVSRWPIILFIKYKGPCLIRRY